MFSIGFNSCSCCRFCRAGGSPRKPDRLCGGSSSSLRSRRSQPVDAILAWISTLENDLGGVLPTQNMTGLGLFYGAPASIQSRLMIDPCESEGLVLQPRGERYCLKQRKCSAYSRSFKFPSYDRLSRVNRELPSKSRLSDSCSSQSTEDERGPRGRQDTSLVTCARLTILQRTPGVSWRNAICFCRRCSHVGLPLRSIRCCTRLYRRCRPPHPF